jgi:hypothetical protein
VPDPKIKTKPVNLNSRIHKGQRFALFKLSIQAGTLDHENKAALNAIRDDLAELKRDFHLHAELEEKFIHPFLYERVPGAAKEIELDHQKMHIMIDELVSHFNGIMGRPNTFEKIGELCLEFYLALNRFISFYLAHIDKEDERIQPTLWVVCTNEELGATFSKMVASQSPQELMYNLSIMIPALNIEELTGRIAMAKSSMSPTAFKEVCELAQSLLDPQTWSTLKLRVGIE